MSGRFPRRPKTAAMAPAGVSAIGALPPELLETICVFLDVRTLCTARLVCSQFRRAASRCIHSVELAVETLHIRPETTLNSFPNLSQVSVFGLKHDDLRMLAESPIADTVTHLRAVEHLRPLPQQLQSAPDHSLLPLPNLSSLAVGYTRSSFFPLPQTLRELALEAPIRVQDADVVSRLTNLTCLRITVPNQPFEAVIALTALQRLDITSDLSLIPFVAELTLLTHLQFQGLNSIDSLSVLPPLGSLSRLRRLVHLGFTHRHASLEGETLLVTSIATLAGLRSLDLALRRRPNRSAFETACMAPFSQLTALRLKSERLDAGILLRFNLEGLRDLSFPCGVELDRDALAALRRATGLTRLRLWTWTEGARVGPEELEVALSHMPQLRALSLVVHDKGGPLFSATPRAVRARTPLKAIGLLTELTQLELSGRGVTTNASVEMCLGLKKLRVLSLSTGHHSPPSDPVTPETFFALAKLPELHKFDIIGDVGNVGISGADLTEDVWLRLNGEKYRKGWPALDLNLNTPWYSSKLLL